VGSEAAVKLLDLSRKKGENLQISWVNAGLEYVPVLAPGTELGRYRLTALLGVGGMGEVYRARDLRLDRDVAVKVLPERFAEDPERLARFEREAKAVAALAHPNILSIYDYASSEGRAFTVTELLEGETLRRRLEEGPLPWDKAVTMPAPMPKGSFIGILSRPTCF